MKKYDHGFLIQTIHDKLLLSRSVPILSADVQNWQPLWWRTSLHFYKFYWFKIQELLGQNTAKLASSWRMLEMNSRFKFVAGFLNMEFTQLLFLQFRILAKYELNCFPALYLIIWNSGLSNTVQKKQTIFKTEGERGWIRKLFCFLAFPNRMIWMPFSMSLPV